MLDVDKFITLVQEDGLLWYVGSATYTDKNEVARVWKKVFKSIFLENWANLDEKRESKSKGCTQSSLLGGWQLDGSSSSPQASRNVMKRSILNEKHKKRIYFVKVKKTLQ